MPKPRVLCVYFLFLKLLSPASGSVPALWWWHCHSRWHPVLSRYVKLQIFILILYFFWHFYLNWYVYSKYWASKHMENKTIHMIIPKHIININDCLCVVFQELTAGIMKGAPSLPNTCFMDYMEEISWIWNICLRNFLRKCWTVSFSSVVVYIFNDVFLLALVFIYSVSTVTCLLARCNPSDQGGVCPSVLQPNELQLPVALRVSLEKPASLLHDRGRGEKALLPP